MINNKSMKRYRRYAEGGMTTNDLMSQALGSQGNIAGGIGASLDVITGMFGQSNARSLKEAQKQGVMDAAKGLASGAQAGMMFGGPVGAAIGAGVGMWAGAIGHSGGIDATEGFTQDNEYRYTTGLKRLFGKGKTEMARFREDQEDVKLNRFAVGQTAELNDRWSKSKENVDAQYMYARGGMTRGSMAFVDDGEVIQRPDGQTQIVPERGRKQDANLEYFPAGTMILSDKLKFPGTKKTFADVSKEMMAKISKGNDKYAEGTNALNLMYNAETNRNIFMLQEAYKRKNGIKSDAKRVPQFKKGGYVNGVWVAGDEQNQAADSDGMFFDYRTGVWKSNEAAQTQSATTSGIIPPTTRTSGAAGTTYGQMSYGNPALGYGQQQSTYLPTGMKDYGQLASNAKGYSADTQGFTTPNGLYGQQKQLNFGGSNTGSTGGGSKGDSSSVFGTILDGASKLATLLPSLSNLNQKADKVGENHNPYESLISGTMSKRRMNILPTLDHINRVAMTGNYNADKSSAGTGAGMAQRVAINLGQQANIGQAMATKQNVDNQYAGEYANMLNDLGKQRVQAKNSATDINARNKAAADNARQAGLSQISQFAQMQSLEKNQKNRDMMMMQLYGPFLDRGNTSATMKEFMKYFKKSI